MHSRETVAADRMADAAPGLLPSASIDTTTTLVWRLFGPVLAFGAIGLFVTTLGLACIVGLVWPVIVVLLSALVAPLRPDKARLWLGDLSALLADIGRTLADTYTAIRHPLHPVPVSLPRVEPLPDLEAFANRVAEDAGSRGFDGAIMIPEANFGVIEVMSPQGRRTILLAGAPLLFILTVDELRAVVAHELGHIALKHTTWGTVIGRWTNLVARMGHRLQDRFHPLTLSLRLSGWLLRAAREPWSRADEFDADRFAATLCGRTALTSALRKVNDQGASLGLLMDAVYLRSVDTGIGPDSWTEAAYRLFAALQPAEKRQLRRALLDDPFDVDGRSHPPVALRIGALSGLPRTPQVDHRRAISAFPGILAHEKTMTMRFIEARRRVPARRWFDEVRPERFDKALARQVAAASAGYPEFEIE